MACADNLAFLRPIADASVALVVTSPPYTIGKTSERRSAMDEYVRQQATVVAECVRVLRPGGSLCWQVGNHVDDGEVVPLDIVMYGIVRQHGLKLRNRIVWHFE